MRWKLAGQKVDKRKLSPDTDISAKQIVEGDPYLIRNGYYIPYFDPHEQKDEMVTRERLNLELCDRIIRESEIRYVSRKIASADQAIDEMMQAISGDSKPAGRGIHVVLFQNIVNRIRELSNDFLELRSMGMDDIAPDKVAEIQNRIRRLYEFVMVEHQDILLSVRRSDGSADVDGTIRELFSEVGKPHAIPLAVIYENRVGKIGKALASMDAVFEVIRGSLERATDTPKSHIILAIEDYVIAAKKLATIPSSDHFAYNDACVQCINTRDISLERLESMQYLNVSEEKRRGFLMMIQSGILLIQDMLNLRDERSMSVEFFKQKTDNWDY
ncbi:MAG: hypothetical protein MRY32_05270 [Rickettsiales bacterium]|nr:hypothetical protein [Rickettsiales bacterium]